MDFKGFRFCISDTRADVEFLLSGLRSGVPARIRSASWMGIPEVLIFLGLILEAICSLLIRLLVIICFTRSELLFFFI